MPFYAFSHLNPGQPENTFAYAVPRAGGGAVESEPWDGQIVETASQKIKANYICLNGKSPGMGSLVEFRGRMVITDSRVILVADAPEASGRIFAGHLRYEWLAEVGYQEKSANNMNQILLRYVDGDRANWLAQIIFKKRESVAEYANLILHRACAYRLAMTDEKSEDERSSFVKWAARDIPRKPNPQLEPSCVSLDAYLAPGGEKFRPIIASAQEIVVQCVPELEVSPAEQLPAEPPQEAQPPENPPRFCNKCGNKLKEGAQFCNQCGAQTGGQ